MQENVEETSDKQSFSKRHPRLNLLLAIVLLLFLVVVGIGIILYVVNQIQGLLSWLLTNASKMDAVVIVGIITGGVSLVSVVISSVISKFIEYKKNRQDYLAQKREIPYGEFVDMIYKVQGISKNKNSYTPEDMVADISKFSRQLTLWGSHRVVNKWVKFRENGANPESAQNNLLLMEDIMNEMRHDLGLRRVKQGNLLAFFVNDIKEKMKEMKK